MLPVARTLGLAAAVFAALRLFKCHPEKASRDRPGPDSGDCFSPVRGTLLRRGTCLLLLLLALAGALGALPVYPAFAQDAAPLWSADMSVAELGNGSIGAFSTGDFTNQGGRAGLQAKWLYYDGPNRTIRLAFTEVVRGEELTLQVGPLTLNLPPDSRDSSFTWHDVGDVGWKDGQTIPVRIVEGVNTPATGVPAITGRAEAGETLTADISGISDADGLENAAFSYQWVSNDGSADSDIENATGSTYELTDNDIAKSIRVRVSFTDDAGNRESLTSEPTAAVAANPNSPATGVPTIGGTAQVGETLTADTSGIADADGLDNAVFGYQWLAGGTAIDGATSTTYTPADSDVGKTVKVRVSFTDDAGNEETLTSEPTAATAAVAAKPNTPATGQPAITGTAQVGETLTASTTDIADEDGLDNAAFSYQWMAESTHIAGETVSTYTLVPADAGKTIKVKVSFTDDADNTETLTSEATATVAATVPDAPQDVQVSPVGASQALDVTWEAPASDGGSAVTGYKVQWKSGEEDYDASREATVSVRPFLLWWYRITGLTNGSVYTIRVIATNSAGGGLPSAEISDAPLADLDRLRRFIAVDVVEAHESSHQWLRTTWDYMKSGVELRVHYSGHPRGQVSTVCSYDDGLLKCRSGYMTIAERSVDSLGILIHEMAHVFSLTNGFVDEPAPLGAAYLYFDSLAIASHGFCLPSELFADILQLSVVGASANRGQGDAILGYWELCNRDYQVGHADPLTEESLTVVRSALSGQMPQWFVDTYHDSNGNADLEQLWSDIKSMKRGDGRSVVAYRLRDQFGGYCGNPQVAAVLDIVSDSERESDDEIRNPWRDGGCVPEAPGALRTVLGNNQLELSWEAPVYDGGSRIRGYAVEWKSGDEDYHESRRTVLDDPSSHSHTVTGLTEGVEHTLRVTAFNVFGDGEYAAVTSSNSPATGLPTISGTARVGETLTASTSGIADEDGLSNPTYSYLWIRNDGATDSYIQDATYSTYTLTDTAAGKTIKVRVSFADDKGNGETLTSDATAVVAATVPGVPEHVRVTPHDSQALDVSWEAPASDGGSAVTGHRVQWKKAIGSWDTPEDVSEAIVTGSTHTIHGLTEGTAYSVRVLASNEVGDGSASAELAGTPRETTPPSLSTATVNGAILTLAYDEALDENSVPASETFSVTAGDVTTTVDSVSISDSSVTLTLSSAVTKDVAVTVSYAVPTGLTTARIKDLAGNAAPALSSQAVVNYTGQSADYNSAQWSATMTVGVSNGVYGYESFYFKMGALSDKTITLDGSVYTLYSLTHSNSGSPYVTLDRALSSGFLLLLDGVEFASDDASTLNGATSYVYSWSRGDLNWSYGEEVNVSLVLVEEEEQAENTRPTGLPDITGTPQVGQMLMADVSGIADADGLENATFAYQWVADDADIDGATAPTYTPVSADVGKTVKVRVSFADDAGNEETLTSEPTEAVAAKPNSPATGAPTIGGTAQVGETLTADTSGIADADGLTNATFSYQWFADDADIQDATDSSYTVADGDEGKAVKVEATFTDDSGNEETLTSAATAEVTAPPLTSQSISPSFPATETGARSVAENTAAGVDFGDAFVATDPEMGSVSYSLGGPGAALFAIDASSGQLRTAAALDHEEQPTHSVTVIARDASGLTAEIDVTITVTNVDEAGSLSFFPTRPQVGTVLKATLSDPDGIDRTAWGDTPLVWNWERSSDQSSWEEITDFGTAMRPFGPPYQLARRANYTPTTADLGKYLRATVTYLDNEGPGKTVEKVLPQLVGGRAPAPEITVVELVSGLTHPWGLAFAPDGTMLFTERGGGLNSRLPGGKVQTVSADLSDLGGGGERGMLGLVVDPDFATSRRFYTCSGHTGGPWEMQVIAWSINNTYTEAVRIADPLVGGIPISRVRNGCRLRFGPEGFLWITTGDAEIGTSAQDLASLGGKVLRVDPSTGAGAPTNPFAQAPLVYTYGHRNPQGLALRPGTNQMWSVEHGTGQDDEINLLVSGGNYGWDPDANPGYNGRALMTDLEKFPQAIEANWSSGYATPATSGGIFLEGSDWGEWEGRLAVATLKTRSVRIFEFTATGTFVSQVMAPELDGTYGRLRTPMLGPDGGLYLTSSNGDGRDRILKVVPVRPPAFGAEADSGPLTKFTVVDTSRDPDDFVGTLEDGSTLTLDNPANGSYGIRVDTESGVEIGSVRLQLAGKKSVFRIEGVSPYSLYGGEGDGALHGESLPTGDYTLTATAYSEADSGGDILGTLEVSFTVAAANSPAAGTPSISGTAQVGETLTADITNIADADGLGNATFSYRWLADDADIENATNSSYTPADGDEGKAVRVQVSFTDDAGNEETLTSVATEAVAPRPSPQWSADMRVVEYAGVSIGASSADLFSNIRATRGLQVEQLWSYTPDRDLRLYIAEAVPYADELTLRVGGLSLEFPAGSSREVRFKWEDVDVDWEDGQTVPVGIFLTSALAEPAPNTPATGAPSISGTAQVGETLTADVSRIADADGLDNAAFAYQWVADDADIEGATDSSYTLADGDEGKAVKVRVSFTDDAGNEETLTSESTGEVAAKPNTPATGLPTIGGTAQVGETLTADVSGIADEDGLGNAAFAHQWVAADTDIEGATGPTYEPTEDDAGKSVRVRVSFTDDAGHEESLTSEATAAIAARPNTPATGQPAITGTAQVGETLTADTSGIADADGLDNAAFAYQWVADDADIDGATNPTYTLADSEEGKTVKVRATFTDDAGYEEALTSEATAAVTYAAGPPGAPREVGVQVGDSELQVTWQAPADENRAPVERYRIRYGEEGGSSREVHTALTTHTLGNLTNGVAYMVQVTAENAAGYGPASAEMSATPRAEVTTEPDTPQNLTGKAVYHRRVSLDWDDVFGRGLLRGPVLRLGRQGAGRAAPRGRHSGIQWIERGGGPADRNVVLVAAGPGGQRGGGLRMEQDGAGPGDQGVGLADRGGKQPGHRSADHQRDGPGGRDADGGRCRHRRRRRSGQRRIWLPVDCRRSRHRRSRQLNIHPGRWRRWQGHQGPGELHRRRR